MKIEIDTSKIKRIIYDNNLDIKSLISKTNLSSAHIYRILNGEQTKVFERTFFSLARVLKCNPEDITCHHQPIFPLDSK